MEHNVIDWYVLDLHEFSELVVVPGMGQAGRQVGASTLNAHFFGERHPTTARFFVGIRAVDNYTFALLEKQQLIT